MKLFNRHIGQSEIGLIIGLLVVTTYIVLVALLPVVQN